ncbi:cilia- and flagella-associated protein 418-like [Amphiura filiformis]|uniref:cilia- and flagella-associated protein 418-like n=1 Tax=Amphiura filiformis TaxID=82378 RepID=UPI003B20FDCE
MADDIDDLLDEVETKFCVKGNEKKAKTVSSKRKPIKKTAVDDDLNDMINDIIDEPDLDDDLQPGPVDMDKRVRSSSQSQMKKCLSVFLGGSSASVGAASATTQRTCDQLRCTSCDFKIVYFDNYEWDKTCDYLFFRNNVPDFEKLRAKLKMKKGSRAYACQCKWRSIKSLVALSQDTDLKWVCGKHAS